jgi:uncharacterized membrane protein
VTVSSTASSLDSDGEGSPAVAAVVDRNIEALLARRRTHDQNKSFGDRIAGAVTAFAGSMSFVYLHVVVVAGWVAWNSGWFRVRRADPSFSMLAVTASIEAIFLSTFVLINQNRMNQLADERADLDVHVGLLTEHEVTRLITLVAAIGRKLNIDEADAPEITDLQTDTRPEQMMKAMSDQAEPIITSSSS